ncbi:MAG: YceI family protein [Myxococcales bacterium]|jgi:polyisoprenoid-binding protein YceI
MRVAFVLSFAVLVGIGCEDPGAKVTPATVGAPAPTKAESAPTGANPAPTATALVIDPSNSKVEFVGAKVTRSHGGGFTDFAGKVELAEPTESSHVEITIQTASLYADEEKLAKHLKSPDFFDVNDFPTATFRSTEIKKRADDYQVTGDLTLHGVTKRVSFPATIQVSDGAVKASSEFSINRHDFGISYPGMKDDLIRDLVVIKLRVDLPRQS